MIQIPDGTVFEMFGGLSLGHFFCVEGRESCGDCGGAFGKQNTLGAQFLHRAVEVAPFETLEHGGCGRHGSRSNFGVLDP